MTSADATAPRRLPYWDNAKGLLVTLVVVGHAVQPAAATVPFADVLYRFVYLFHMPAFVFVTGVLTAELTVRRAGRLVTGLLVPYVIFQTLQSVEVSLLTGAPSVPHPLVPRWTLWYLVATVLWRLSAPLWLALRPAVAVGGAVLLALAAGVGTGAGHLLALDDALGFLPFFVFGLVLRSRADALSRRPRAPVVAVAVTVLVGALGAVVLTRGAFSRSVLQLGFAAEAVGTSDARATVLRLALIAAATVVGAAVLVLLPRERSVLTIVGVASLTVYLLHPLVLLPLRGGSLVGGTTTAVLTALAAIALVALLCSAPLRALTSPLVTPSYAVALLRRATSGDASRADASR